MPPNDNTIFSNDAFAHMGKTTVPLTFYGTNGERIVIGEATVEGDSTGLRILETKITDERFKDVLNVSNSFSIEKE